MCLAKMAAQSGISVLLLEQSDFASGTSSRSSKMAHGGLRYLEMFDFEQVYEGIRSREDLFKRMPNLARPERFLIPVKRGDYWFRFKLGVGLTIYDLMSRGSARRHKWIPGASEAFGSQADLAGCFEYTDGLMSDSRLVFEFLTAARQLGAVTLNYTQVESCKLDNSGLSEVVWIDQARNEKHASRCKLVVNCAGPWATEIKIDRGQGSDVKLRYSRGSHLVFSTPWRHPSLFLPLEEKGRYYFVWPHQSGGTLVGTTEREVSQLYLDPQPSPDEVEEIVKRLERDLPHAGLNRTTLSYGFAGIRSLPARPGRLNRAGVSRLSRKHIWELKDGTLSLYGGKYTTFAWTASEGLRLIFKRFKRALSQLPDPYDGLPSVVSESERARLFSMLKSKIAVSDDALNRATSRLGNQVLIYLDRPEAWSEIAEGVLNLEAIHAIEVEQAVTIEDLLRRRLELEATPSHGIAALDALERELGKVVEPSIVSMQRGEYLGRIERLMGVLKPTSSPPSK